VWRGPTTHPHPRPPHRSRHQGNLWVGFSLPCTRVSTAHHSLHTTTLYDPPRGGPWLRAHTATTLTKQQMGALFPTAPSPTTRVTSTRTIMRGVSPCSSSQGVCSWTGGVYVLGFHELWHNGEGCVEGQYTGRGVLGWPSPSTHTRAASAPLCLHGPLSRFTL
jgi:hypothetical protein